MAEVLHDPGSCCSPEPRGDRHSLREVLQVHLQVSGLEGRMEGNPGLEGRSCLQVFVDKVSAISADTFVSWSPGRDKYRGKLSDWIMPSLSSVGETKPAKL